MKPMDFSLAINWLTAAIVDRRGSRRRSAQRVAPVGREAEALLDVSFFSSCRRELASYLKPGAAMWRCASSSSGMSAPPGIEEPFLAARPHLGAAVDVASGPARLAEVDAGDAPLEAGVAADVVDAGAEAGDVDEGFANVRVVAQRLHDRVRDLHQVVGVHHLVDAAGLAALPIDEAGAIGAAAGHVDAEHARQAR
jgi:hypothetical protein